MTKTLLILLAILGLACTDPAPNPVPPSTHRIISLVPAVTEMLFAIGAGPEVVGVSSYDNFPPEVATRPKVGALVDPDFERILTLRPDLVMVYGSQEDLMHRLDAARIGYYSYRHSGLAGIMTTIRELGARTGHEPEAARVAGNIEARLDAIRASVAGKPRPRTALVFGREAGALRGIYVSAGVGFLHDLLDAAGGSDAFADVGREGLQVSTEALLARRPDVILELRASEGWTPARIADERLLWKRLSSLPAVKTDRIAILPDSSFTIPGPRIVAAAEAMAAVLHPRDREDLR